VNGALLLLLLLLLLRDGTRETWRRPAARSFQNPDVLSPYVYFSERINGSNSARYVLYRSGESALAAQSAVPGAFFFRKPQTQKNSVPLLM
jgi:hypothetical protein